MTWDDITEEWVNNNEPILLDYYRTTHPIMSGYVLKTYFEIDNFGYKRIIVVVGYINAHYILLTSAKTTAEHKISINVFNEYLRNKNLNILV